MPIEKPNNSFNDDDDFFLHRSYKTELQEDGGQKLGREIYVISGGAMDAARQAFSQEKRATAIETGLAAAGGLAIKAAEAKLPSLRPALAIGGAAMTSAFVGDLLGHGAEIKAILADTWANKDHDEQNRQLFSAHGGKFVFDLALTSGAGLAGAAGGEQLLFAESRGFTRISTYDGLGLAGKLSRPHNRLFHSTDEPAQVFQQAAAAALKLKVSRAGSTSRFKANGFLISEEGLAVTNHHVIKDASTIKAVDHHGQQFDVSVLASNESKDLAVLQLHRKNPATIFEPLKLASKNATADEPIYLIGHEAGHGPLKLAPGRVSDEVTVPDLPLAVGKAARNKNTISVTVTPFGHELVLKPTPTSAYPTTSRLLGSYYSRPGFSGSPIINGNGEVVAIHVGNLGSKFSQLTGRKSSTRVSALQDLLPEALSAKTAKSAE